MFAKITNTDNQKQNTLFANYPYKDLILQYCKCSVIGYTARFVM